MLWLGHSGFGSFRPPTCGEIRHQPSSRILPSPTHTTATHPPPKMSHPVVYWKKPFFYAIGNTPAVCLTQDLAPEEAANILLLGCGDPRNILFTIYSIADNGICACGGDFWSCTNYQKGRSISILLVAITNQPSWVNFRCENHFIPNHLLIWPCSSERPVIDAACGRQIGQQRYENMEHLLSFLP